MKEPRRGRRSAGLLLFRWQHGALQVFLVHPGGPFWARRDQGAWSIPKGEYAEHEDALQAAQREVQEETGFVPRGPFLPLTPCRQRGGKLISAWAACAPELDPAQLRSNSFQLEWPPHSGVQRQFPEVDRGAWWPLPEARSRLLAGQQPLLAELLARLGSGEGDAGAAATGGIDSGRGWTGGDRR
jgi:predicted NUDIX family NTP pyrophosphohydrolase